MASDDLLLMRSGRRLCALPATHVEETMRPLPCEVLPDLPAFVRGVAIVRGRPTPVLDLRQLLGDPADAPPARLVTLKVDAQRRAGLLVDAVLGLHPRGASSEGLPPLLQDAGVHVVAELARLDDRLLTVLRAGRLVPEEAWSAMAPPEASA